MWNFAGGFVFGVVVMIFTIVIIFARSAGKIDDYDYDDHGYGGTDID